MTKFKINLINNKKEYDCKYKNQLLEKVLKMKKVKAMFFITISIFMLNILLTPQIGQSIFVNYPYSVKIGDKIDYHLDILTNGTETGTYNVFGLNMTQGDNFQLEIFDAIASN